MWTENYVCVFETAVITYDSSQGNKFKQREKWRKNRLIQPPSLSVHENAFKETDGCEFTNTGEKGTWFLQAPWKNATYEKNHNISESIGSSPHT